MRTFLGLIAAFLMIACQSSSSSESMMESVMEEFAQLGGTGGIFAVDSKGEVEMVFNTSGIFRAAQRAGEEPLVAMFK